MHFTASAVYLRDSKPCYYCKDTLLCGKKQYLQEIELFLQIISIIAHKKRQSSFTSHKKKRNLPLVRTNFI